MALIHCHECGKEISDSAEHCPHCGCKTSHGQRVVASKALLYKMVIAAIALFLGAFFVFNSWTQLSDHGSYYWRYHGEEQFKLYMKLAAGVGMLIGGLIVMLQVKNSAEELQYTEQHSAPAPQKQHSAPAPQKMTAPPAFIPEDKRKHGCCSKCGAQGVVAECKLPNQFGDFDLCPKCINQYNGKIR